MKYGSKDCERYKGKSTKQGITSAKDSKHGLTSANDSKQGLSSAKDLTIELSIIKFQKSNTLSLDIYEHQCSQ